MKLLLEPITAQFIEQLNAAKAPPIYTLTVEEARNVLDSLQAQSIAVPGYSEDITITTAYGTIGLRIIRPDNIQNNLPVIMYFHGGGWILGNEYTHDRLIRQIALQTQAAVIFVKYTPSPEAHYPTAIEEAYAATTYIAKEGHRLGLDTSKIVVAGDSVGGNMATVVSLLAKERIGPTISYQLLFYPATDSSLSTVSYQELAQGPWLTKAAMEWFWNAYEPQKDARVHPLLSPLQATIEQLTGLPPALVITAEYDVLRDEGEAYAHKLMQAGVPTRAVRILGTIHDFLMLNPLAQSSATQAALDLIQVTTHHIFRTKN